MKLNDLKTAISNTTAAFRCRQRLQPGGGDGEKIFPPTYAGAVYAVEERRVKTKDGQLQTLPCVLLDSVQSQANRMEEALQQALDDGRFGDCPIPLVVVDFSDADLLDDIRRVTSLQAPHRVADAILRDSLLDGMPFRESAIGQRLDLVSLQNATPLYEICPTALIFGMWDSTGPKGGLGAKFQRAIVSEIVGVNAVIGKRTSSRIDPLQIRAAARVVRAPDGSWSMAPDARARGAIAPSEINHGNIPPDISDGGVTLDYAEQTTVISLPALRRLRFPLNGEKPNKDADGAGQTVLLALALCSAALAAERGFDLRSRCLLFPEAPLEWEILATPGKMPDKVTIDVESAIAVLREAVAATEKLGLTWRKEPLVLKPRPQLIALVRRSQELATAETTEPAPAA